MRFRMGGLRALHSVRGLLVGVAAVTAISVMGSSTAHARVEDPPVPPGVQSIMDTVELFEDTYSEDITPAAQKLVEDTRTAIANGSILLHLPKGASLSPQGAQVWQNRKTEGQQVVRLPYTGTAVDPSAVTVTYTAGSVTQVDEEVYQELGENEGQVTAWSNGQLKLAKTISASSYADVFGSDAQADAYSSWLSRFTDCLHANGLSWWKIGAIVAVCSAACVTGVLCWSCVIKFGAQYGPVIVDCAAKA